jgi:hypothetical protein
LLFLGLIDPWFATKISLGLAPGTRRSIHVHRSGPGQNSGRAGGYSQISFTRPMSCNLQCSQTGSWVLGREAGPEIADFGSLPGPTRPGGFGKGSDRCSVRFAPIFSPVDQVNGQSGLFFEPLCDCIGAVALPGRKSGFRTGF